MTESLFFDTDCISAFLWVNKTSILQQLYPGKIIIPKQVYTELSRPNMPHLKQRLDVLINTGDAKIMDILTESNDYNLYLQMTNNPQNGYKIIGQGEAASLILAKTNNGIIASNNLRDIEQYIKDWNLKSTTTADILVESYKNGLITENNGNIIWANMLSKKRKIGANSFTEYLNKIKTAKLNID